MINDITGVKKIKMRSTINIYCEYCSVLATGLAQCFGKIPTNILKPSNGGIGIKLKMVSIRLYRIISATKIAIILDELNGSSPFNQFNLNGIENIAAISKLVKGPAAAMIAIPFRGVIFNR